MTEPAPTDDVAPSTCVNCGHVGTYHDDGPCGRGIGGGEICGCENYEASAWPAPTDDVRARLRDELYTEALAQLMRSRRAGTTSCTWRRWPNWTPTRTWRPA